MTIVIALRLASMESGVVSADVLGCGTGTYLPPGTYSSIQYTLFINVLSQPRYMCLSTTAHASAQHVIPSRDELKNFERRQAGEREVGRE